MSSIDIVIPCHRYGRFLRQCVESALLQDVDPLRVLILDDASPDETSEVGMALAGEDKRVEYRRHAFNQGHIATYNEGIEWTRSDYMLLLSADDYLLPGALGRAIELLDRHADVGLCYGQAIALQADGGSQDMQIGVDQGAELYILLTGAEFIRRCAKAMAENFVPTPTAVVRTSLLKRLGGYLPELPHSGDLELWLRLAAYSSVGVVHANQAVYRRHADNMSHHYFRDGHLPDLQQRKAAIDAFRRIAAGALPDSEDHYAELLLSLAKRAVHHASAAFNENEVELSLQLCDYACRIAPRVRSEWPWRLLAAKRLLGSKASAVLLPVVAQMRALRARTWASVTPERKTSKLPQLATLDVSTLRSALGSDIPSER